MKKILKKIIEIVAGFITRRIISKYKPLIIGVTGSVGKTSVKDAIYAVLKNKYQVNKSWGNLNTELGIPLAVAGYKNAGTSLTFWIKALWKMVCLYWDGEKKIKSILVLEMGADKPGDIKKLVKLAPPDIGVVTNVGISHLEYFKKVSNIVAEKRKLVEALEPAGCAVLCGDNQKVLSMDKKTKARVITYGLERHNLVKATNLVFHYEEKPMAGKELDWSISFKLNYQDTIIPVRLKNMLGAQQVQVVLAAVSCSICMGMNLLEASEALVNYVPPLGRMKIIHGLNGSFILDDTYNSAPASTLAALEILAEVYANKKIVVLADMLELGSQEKKGHQEVGEKAGMVADFIFTYGEKGALIAKSAKATIKKSQAVNVRHFENQEDLIGELKNLLDQNLVVLIKGSQKMRMEKVVKAVMAEPNQAKKLLVRQGKGWG
ncbi:MAG: UDP-N-acetylmuramoyl-tripeptide--D-alanyl-D-alanine ligase [Patescibacteria group bacterium]|nr:UDP-N-acetylmuramoyl-tripeptide--D-alanyl-D-alanine ligase [Patescibacteria group bacterium]